MQFLDFLSIALRIRQRYPKIDHYLFHFIEGIEYPAVTTVIII